MKKLLLESPNLLLLQISGCRYIFFYEESQSNRMKLSIGLPVLIFNEES